MWHCEAGGTFYGRCIFLPAVTPVSISWSFYVAHIPGPPLSRYPDIELKPQSRKIRLFISPWVTIYQGGWNCASFCTQNREFMLCFVEIETRFTVIHSAYIQVPNNLTQNITPLWSRRSEGSIERNLFIVQFCVRISWNSRLFETWYWPNYSSGAGRGQRGSAAVELKVRLEINVWWATSSTMVHIWLTPGLMLPLLIAWPHHALLEVTHSL